MRVISLLRSAVAGPRRGLAGALAILTVIVGVVAMHSLSGSPATHAHPVPHEAAPAQVAAAHPAAVPVMTRAAEQPATVAPVVDAPAGHAGNERDTGPCCSGCGGHDAAMAMCLMILVALLALVAPVRRLLWRAPVALTAALPPARATLGGLAAPSLHELCISRT
ncbi:DUF6153 family protein [Promicromonospora sp. NPDC052451]|uniref:DUF6153 family protein n=1 Tax=Promicromonospora sp. NPDC052451 TaxID=3364407 RepID=UPI0037CB0D69